LDGCGRMAGGWHDVLSAWDDFRAEAEEFREIDSERVPVLAHKSGRGKTIGLELGQMRTRAANVFHVRDSMVVKFVIYWDRDLALADLGLTPDTGT
jgi:hypothetical protein